jgi:hypothetical protein
MAVLRKQSGEAERWTLSPQLRVTKHRLAALVKSFIADRNRIAYFVALLFREATHDRDCGHLDVARGHGLG